LNNFFEELKRRKVYRTATAYAVVAFIIMQLVEIVFPLFDIPNWAGRMVIIILLFGFPVVLILSWMFDITRDSAKNDEIHSVTKETGIMSRIDSQIDGPLFYKKKRTGLAITGIILVLVLWVVSVKNFETREFFSSSEKSLAVVSFQNLSEDKDESRIGQILQELIITDLSDIPLLKLFSSQRLFDVQKQLGLKNNRSIDPAMALDVAKAVGANNMLTGNIIDTGIKKVLTSRLVKVNDGSVIKTHSVEGNNIYSLVDKLTALVKGDLKISGKGPDLEIKEKTTESIAAFRYYLDGVELLNDNRYEEAAAKLNESIKIDGFFNDALYLLAIAEWWEKSLNPGEANPEKDPIIYLRRILDGDKVITTEYREKVEATLLLMESKWHLAKETFEKLVKKYPQEKDNWYNLGECYFHSGEMNLKALDAFEKTLKLDPEYTLAYTHIFDIYFQEKMFDRSISLAQKFIKQKPQSPRGYLALSRVLIVNGEFDQANFNLQMAKKFDPNDFNIDLEKIRLAQFEENYTKALNIIESLLINATKIQNRSLLAILTNIRMEQGQYTRSIIAKKMSLTLMAEGIKGDKNRIYMEMAGSALYMNDVDSFEDYMSLIDHSNISTGHFLRYKLLYGMMDYQQNNAKELAKVYDDIVQKINSSSYQGDLQYISSLLLGLLHIQKNELNEAELIFRGPISKAPGWGNIATLYLAELYIRKENPEKALVLSQQLLSPSINISFYHIAHPRGYYIKGKALEALNRNKEAIEAYRHLLKVWDNADPTIPELIDTKIRLANLINKA